MDIKETQRCLGEVDIQALSEAILSQEPGAWTEQLSRQQTYEVHRYTESIVLLFCDEEWPDGEIRRETGWDRLADVAMPLIDKIINTHYPPGGSIIRAMAAKLLAGCNIRPHVDSGPSFQRAHRIHIPITSNSWVRFTIDGRPHQLQVGQAYEINNQKRHSVMNKGKEDRITFIFDYIPPQELV